MEGESSEFNGDPLDRSGATADAGDGISTGRAVTTRMLRPFLRLVRANYRAEGDVFWLGGLDVDVIVDIGVLGSASGFHYRNTSLREGILLWGRSVGEDGGSSESASGSRDSQTGQLYLLSEVSPQHG